jgi:hypothetical protein
MLSRPATAEPALRRLRLLSAIALATFGLIIAVITLWPGPPDPDGQSWLRELLRNGQVYGIPTWITYGRVEFVSNVVMFLPVGFFGALALSRHRWLVVPAAAIASTVIETVQAMALPLRYGTVRDVISNTLGALLGYLLAVAVISLLLRRARRTTGMMPAPAPTYR